MKRYSILVFENQSERELCQCESNPEAIVAAAEKETRLIYKKPGSTRRSSAPRYSQIRIRDNRPE